MPRCLAARLLRCKITPRYRTLSTESAPGPPKASDVRVDNGGGMCAVSDGAEAATMVILYYRLRLAAQVFAVFSMDPFFYEKRVQYISRIPVKDILTKCNNALAYFP